MDPTTCDFFQRSPIVSCLINTLCQKTYLMNSISCEFFSKVRFKYLETK